MNRLGGATYLLHLDLGYNGSGPVMTNLSSALHNHVISWDYLWMIHLCATYMKSPLSHVLSCAVCCIGVLAAPALAAEKNPPGDIPDDQVFVAYASRAGGYSLKVPEGWARTEKGSDVGFIDKFDGVAVIVDTVATAPTTKDVIEKLQKAEREFKLVNTKQIRLPAGPTLLIKYESESEANPVTNKRIHLEDEAYVFYRNGRMAILTVWAPAGADNADQWKLISESFRW